MDPRSIAELLVAVLMLGLSAVAATLAWRLWTANRQEAEKNYMRAGSLRNILGGRVFGERLPRDATGQRVPSLPDQRLTSGMYFDRKAGIIRVQGGFSSEGMRRVIHRR
jgi:hypothetical protein